MGGCGRSGPTALVPYVLGTDKEFCEFSFLLEPPVIGKLVSDASAEPVEHHSAENQFKHTRLQVFYTYYGDWTDLVPFLYSIMHVHHPPYVISEMEKGVALAPLSSLGLSYFTKKPSSILKNKSPPPHLLEPLL